MPPEAVHGCNAEKLLYELALKRLIRNQGKRKLVVDEKRLMTALLNAPK